MGGKIRWKSLGTTRTARGLRCTLSLPFSDPHPWPDVDLNPRTSPPPAGFTALPSPWQVPASLPIPPHLCPQPPLVNNCAQGVRMRDPPGHPPRPRGAPAARGLDVAFGGNVCSRAAATPSLGPSRSAEAEIVLNEKGPGFICLLPAIISPVYRHAVTSDNNAQRQQMLMSFLCSPHNKSIKTTSENYEPP